MSKRIFECWPARNGWA